MLTHWDYKTSGERGITVPPDAFRSDIVATMQGSVTYAGSVYPRFHFAGRPYYGWRINDEGVTLREYLHRANAKVTGINPLKNGNHTAAIQLDSGATLSIMGTYFGDEFLMSLSTANAYLTDELNPTDTKEPNKWPYWLAATIMCVLTAWWAH